MNVVVAESAGFCFGVQRAVDETMNCAKNSVDKVYTFGPIVHNETVTDMLSELGVQVIGEEALEEAKEGTVIIRAHGVPMKTEEKIRAAVKNTVDLTCPFVKKIHRIVAQAGKDGQTVLILGDPNHPEVIGIVGQAEGPVYVIRDIAELEALNLPKDLSIKVVAQTTFNHKKFENTVEFLRNSYYNANIADTICNATRERQEEAAKIAEQVDLMLVIGSESSSNSQKLYEICKNRCSLTFFIQSMADLENEWFQGVKCVGITAGASTPKIILKEVQNHVRKF